MHIQDISPFDTAHNHLVAVAEVFTSLLQEERSHWIGFERARAQVETTGQSLSEVYIANREGAASDGDLKAALKASRFAGLELTSALQGLHELSNKLLAANKQLEIARMIYMREFGNRALK